jgi:cation transport protein ChaC
MIFLSIEVFSVNDPKRGICAEQRIGARHVDSRRHNSGRNMTLRRLLSAHGDGELWVFGYGSLMWSPCFSYREQRLARAHGYHRALCILSTRYRGTQRSPGLVMGLCRGGSCWGMAFRVAAADVRRALARLWSREMPRRVYEPRLVAVRLRSGKKVRALAFVADPRHPSFVRELDLHGRARLVAQGIGQRGPCVDYIRNTLEHMRVLGVRDPHLEHVLHVALTLQNGSPSACAPAPLSSARAASRSSV